MEYTMSFGFGLHEVASPLEVSIAAMPPRDRPPTLLNAPPARMVFLQGASAYTTPFAPGFRRTQCCKVAAGLAVYAIHLACHEECVAGECKGREVGPEDDRRVRVGIPRRCLRCRQADCS